MSSTEDIGCPRGPHPDLVRKVSALATAGNNNFAYPPEPTFTRAWGCLSWILFISGLVVEVEILAGARLAPDQGDAWKIAIAAMALPILWSLTSWALKRPKFEAEHATRAERMDKWNRSYYCTKDDLLFIPTDDGWEVS